MQWKTEFICFCFWLHRHNFYCFKCNNRRSLYYFSCNCCWCSCMTSKCWIYYFIFLATGIIKELLKTTGNKKKNHDKLLVLAKSKLNSVETLVFRALIDIKISHEELITILKEKEDKYEKMKENVRNVSEKLEQKQENMSVN